MSEEKLDELIGLVSQRSQEDIDRLDKIHEVMNKHGKLLARIDERTLQHEKRMDRSDRRSAGIGTVTGVIGGALAMFVKSLTGGS